MQASKTQQLYIAFFFFFEPEQLYNPFLWSLIVAQCSKLKSTPSLTVGAHLQLILCIVLQIENPAALVHCGRRDLSEKQHDGFHTGLQLQVATQSKKAGSVVVVAAVIRFVLCFLTVVVGACSS